jgi:hypothetical protein
VSVTYPDVAAADRLEMVAQQLHLIGRRRGCSVVLSDREVGAPSDDEYCPGEVAFVVDSWTYRSGFSTGGVFHPAESINARVCATHEQVMTGQPGFIRSRQFSEHEAGR